MVITDVQERIMDVFSRANKSLVDEFRKITLAGSFQEKLPLYEDIKTDFKNYSLLGRDLITEVNTNVLSSLRPDERIRYVNNLSSFLYQIRDGYAYLESDEWLDRIFVSFKSLVVFNNHPATAELTEEDKKSIYEIAEEIRACCYEYVKAADEISAESNDPPIPHLATNIGPSSSSQAAVVPQQKKSIDSSVNENQPKSTTSRFGWKGDKTDLAELVWALYTSNRITDKTTGQPATLKELNHQFELLVGLSLDVVGLMKGRMKTYKTATDGKTFTKELSDSVIERARTPDL